jgi:hypothetical protein
MPAGRARGLLKRWASRGQGASRESPAHARSNRLEELLGPDGLVPSVDRDVRIA